jgi:hypothetical protein
MPLQTLPPAFGLIAAFLAADIPASLPAQLQGSSTSVSTAHRSSSAHNARRSSFAVSVSLSDFQHRLVSLHVWFEHDEPAG